MAGVALGALGLATAARSLATEAWLADLLTFVVPHLFFLSAATLVISLLSMRWWLVLPAIILVAANAWPLFAPRTAPVLAGTASRPLRVMSFNVLFDSDRQAQLLTFLRAAQPDLLIVQEAFPQWKRAFGEIADLYPYTTNQLVGRRFTVLLLSRYPILSAEAIEAVPEHRVEPINGVAIDAVVDVMGQPLEVIAVHAPTPRSAELWEARRTYYSTLADRAAQRDDGRALIVAGDFNMSPWSPFFGRFLARTGLVPAAATGWPAPTRIFIEYGVPRALGVPIDHVLLSPGIGVAGYEVGPDLGSDHRPVIADLELPTR